MNEGENPKKLIIVSATRSSMADFANSELGKCLDALTKTDNRIHLNIEYNNIKGLPEVYNSKIEFYKKYKDTVKYILFVHDDVYIDDLRLYEKLDKAGYDITGLAGCLNCKITNPALWHLMANRNDLRGEVAHPINEKQSMTTVFGPTPSRVLLADGLFLAIDYNKILEKDWKFNENYKFHHYDLAACLDANKKGLKIGVYPIHVIHKSPGLLSTSDKGWNLSNEKFLEEYK